MVHLRKTGTSAKTVAGKAHRIRNMRSFYQRIITVFYALASIESNGSASTIVFRAGLAQTTYRDE